MKHLALTIILIEEKRQILRLNQLLF